MQPFPTRARCASSALVALVVALPAAGVEPEIARRPNEVEHITVSSSKSHAAVKLAIESRLGKLNEHIRQLAQERRADELRAAVSRAARKDDLLWHDTGTHGGRPMLKDCQSAISTSA